MFHELGENYNPPTLGAICFMFMFWNCGILRLALVVDSIENSDDY